MAGQTSITLVTTFPPGILDGLRKERTPYLKISQIEARQSSHPGASNWLAFQGYRTWGKAQGGEGIRVSEPQDYKDTTGSRRGAEALRSEISIQSCEFGKLGGILRLNTYLCVSAPLREVTF